MKITCLHGYFIFEENRAGQVSDFMSLFGFELVAKDGYFTFAALEDAPTFSLQGHPMFPTFPAITTFEGKPWEVMRENQVIYDFGKDLILPLSSVVQRVQISKAGKYFLSSGMILPGSVTDDGLRVTDYSAHFLFDTLKFKYSEVSGV